MLKNGTLPKGRPPSVKGSHKHAGWSGILQVTENETMGPLSRCLGNGVVLGMLLGRYENATFLFLSGGPTPTFSSRQRAAIPDNVHSLSLATRFETSCSGKELICDQLQPLSWSPWRWGWSRSGISSTFATESPCSSRSTEISIESFSDHHPRPGCHACLQALFISNRTLGVGGIRPFIRTHGPRGEHAMIPPATSQPCCRSIAPV